MYQIYPVSENGHGRFLSCGTLKEVFSPLNDQTDSLIISHFNWLKSPPDDLFIFQQLDLTSSGPKRNDLDEMFNASKRVYHGVLHPYRFKEIANRLPSSDFTGSSGDLSETLSQNPTTKGIDYPGP